MMRTVALALALAVSSPALAAGKWTKEQAKKVLTTAEEIRSLDKADVSVDLRTVQDKQETTYDLKILRSTERRAFIDFLGPKEERGRKMLAKGMSYWSTFPDSKRVVAISRREMIGNSAFALADIFQMDVDNDYDPEIVAEEEVNKVKTLKLNLKGKHDEAPYARIEYWVEANGYFPVTAKFYGVSGKHLKTMTVETRKQIAGRERPEVTKMVDEVTSGHVSWWKTKSMVAAEPPDAVFTKDYLKGQ
jgi:outer membrane lipoprotein-sorting protein